MLTRTPPPLEIHLTPEEVAREFCDLDSAQHAAFFVAVGEIVKKEFGGRPGFEMQMVFAAEELARASNGYDDTIPAEFALEVMRTVGNAANA